MNKEVSSIRKYGLLEDAPVATWEAVSMDCEAR
jgi:hypothetical protein